MLSSGILILAPSHGPLEAQQRDIHTACLPWSLGNPLCPKVSGISFRQLLTRRSKASYMSLQNHSKECSVPSGPPAGNRVY